MDVRNYGNNIVKDEKIRYVTAVSTTPEMTKFHILPNQQINNLLVAAAKGNQKNIYAQHRVIHDYRVSNFHTSSFNNDVIAETKVYQYTDDQIRAQGWDVNPELFTEYKLGQQAKICPSLESRKIYGIAPKKLAFVKEFHEKCIPTREDIEIAEIAKDLEAAGNI